MLSGSEIFKFFVSDHLKDLNVIFFEKKVKHYEADTFARSRW